MLLECLVEVAGWNGLGGSKKSKVIPDEEGSRDGEDWKVDCDYEYEEGGWGLWVPWPRIERKEEGGGEGKKQWVERLGCNIVWG